MAAEEEEGGWLSKHLGEALSIPAHVVSKYIKTSVERKDGSITRLFNVDGNKKVSEDAEGKAHHEEDEDVAIAKRPRRPEEYFPIRENNTKSNRIDAFGSSNTFVTGFDHDEAWEGFQDGESDDGESDESNGSLSSFSDDEDMTKKQLLIDLKEFDAKTGRDKYLDACETAHIKPIAYVLDSLDRERISLSHRGIDVAQAKALVACLEQNKYVTNLDLSNNALGPPGGMVLSNILGKSSKLVSINLANNKLGNKAGEAIVSNLELNDICADLSMAGNKLGNGFAKALANAMMEGRNSSVKALNLSHNEIGDEGGIAIGELLEQNESLVQLNLGWNNIRSKGGSAVMEGIASQQSLDLCHKSLKIVVLSWNGVNDAAAQAIEKLIATSQTLELVDLSHNRLGPNCASSIACSLRANKTLQSLQVGFNPLQEPGSLAIVDSLETNRSLRVLGLENTISDFQGSQRLSHRAKFITQHRPQYAEISIGYPPRTNGLLK